MLGVLLALQLLVLVQADWFVNLKQIHKNRCLTPDLAAGLCVPIHHCYSIIKFLKHFSEPLPEEIEIFLDQYICETDDKAPKLCCPPNDIVFNFKNLTEEKLPDVSKHHNLRLLPDSCGNLTLASKITHGRKTNIFEFPWMAIIYYETARGPEFQCGGSIINEKYILTAAHCVTSLKYPLHSVRVGDHTTVALKDCQNSKIKYVCSPPFQDLKIEKVIPHEKYNASTSENDIGLLRVSEIDLEPENTGAVCLPLKETPVEDFVNGTGVIAGWGVTEHGVPSPDLLTVNLPFVSLIVCQSKYGTHAKLDYRQICAGGVDKKDSCGGDSGGPLLVNGTINGEVRLVQQGVVSFGPAKCGELPVPGVYTRVAVFMDWILDHLEP